MGWVPRWLVVLAIVIVVIIVLALIVGALGGFNLQIGHFHMGVTH